MPTPSKAKPKITSVALAPGVRKLKKTKAAPFTAKPKAQSRSGTNRSDIQPVKGASSAIASGVGATKNPARNGSNPITSCKKNGISKLLTLIVMKLNHRVALPKLNRSEERRVGK